MPELVIRYRLTISIHALRKESDKKFLTAPYAYIISIHALRKESDPLTNGKGAHNGKISIHALRKESDDDRLVYFLVDLISIHALRKESDGTAPRTARRSCYFNPRSP